METKPMASNASVAAELRKLQKQAEAGMAAFVWLQDSLRPLIAQLEAPGQSPAQCKCYGYVPDPETSCADRMTGGDGKGWTVTENCPIHRTRAPQPDSSLEELRQAVRDEALREVENAISYFFDTLKGMINTNVACDTLLGRVKALAKFSQPSGQPAKGRDKK